MEPSRLWWTLLLRNPASSLGDIRGQECELISPNNKCLSPAPPAVVDPTQPGWCGVVGCCAGRAAYSC